MEPTAADSSPGPARRLSTSQASVLAFLVAGATLALQILIHRLVSAKLLNNYAFLVISLTMLGFAISGVVLTAYPRLLGRRLADTLLVCCSGMALSAVFATALFTRATTNAAEMESRSALILSFLAWAPYALLLTVPFIFAGVMLGALLSDPQLPTRRIYFFDLVGSALGALVVLPLFRMAGVEAAIIGGLLLLVACVFLLLRPETPILRSVAAATVLLLALAFHQRQTLFAIYYPEGSMLAETRDPKTRTVLEYTEWDPLARIEVSSIAGRAPITGTYASLFGTNRAFLLRYRKLITQNNFAFTFAVDFDGRPESLVGIEETIYASAYAATAVARPSVAVIGVGGGFDILTALRFDASRVTGIEINAATLNIVQNVFHDYFRHWVDDPRVRLINADGRHHLSAAPERFDILQLSGVDSYSGTPGAAHVFSENYLYTSEAFDLYLSRLSDDGILNLMRLEHVPAREMLRAVTTAVAALRRAGIAEPKKHIVTLTEYSGAFTALLVKRRPFSDDELARLKRWAGSRPSFGISAEPGSSNTTPTNAYQAFLSLGDERLEQRFIRGYPFAIDPSVDDRPFFFNFSFWWHLLPGARLFPSQPGSVTPVPVLQLSLVVLGLSVAIVALIAILAPLALLRGREVSTFGKRRFSIFFAGTALGYLAVEIALMQLFGLFLGHPNYSISVVLAALLFSSGLGSLWAAVIIRRLTSIRFVAYLFSALVLGEFLFVFPHLPSLLGLPFLYRALATFALVFPLGMCLGVFLPTAIEAMKERSPHLVPWAWGVNGVFSVLAPLLAVAVATTFGISALLLSSVPIYLAVAFSFAPLRGEASAPVR